MSFARQVNKDFFKTWSPEMAYVLGFFFADGNLTIGERSNYYIAFYSADRSLLLSIRKVMKSTHIVSQRTSETGVVYRIQIGSKEMVNDLLKLGLAARKTKRLALPHIPTQFLGDFVRGYFDGDGNIWAGVINKQRITPTKVIHLAFTSGCYQFLSTLLSQLQALGIHGGSIYPVKKGHCWRLGLSTLDALKLYRIMYNVPSKLTLKRKKKVFEEFAKMRP